MMTSDEVQTARASLTQCLVVLEPIMRALNSGSVAMDAIANADVHRTALLRDVADLVKQADEAKEKRQQWDEMTALSMQRAADAEAEAKARCVAADEASKCTLIQLQDALSLQVATAQSAAADTLQGLALQLADAETAHAAALAALADEKASVQADTTAWTKKLDAIKATAQKFADALKA